MRVTPIITAVCLACGMGVLALAGDEPPSAKAPAHEVGASAAEAAELAEARLRSRLLHETIHGSLQVMHRDFFRDGDDRRPIPSESLEDVFAELERTWQVKVRWLAVDAKAMNPAHRPATPFDERAVGAITDGGEMFESSADGEYQYAGKINLGNRCLKCHVPDRTSLDDRKAAVVISMPLDLVHRFVR